MTVAGQVPSRQLTDMTKPSPAPCKGTAQPREISTKPNFLHVNDCPLSYGRSPPPSGGLACPFLHEMMATVDGGELVFHVLTLQNKKAGGHRAGSPTVVSSHFKRLTTVGTCELHVARGRALEGWLAAALQGGGAGGAQEGAKCSFWT